MLEKSRKQKGPPFCKACKVEHPLSYFRKNGSDRHGKQRYEGICKYVQTGIAPPTQQPERIIEPEKIRPKRIIEPKSPEKIQPKPLIEPMKVEVSTTLEGVDFGHWEQRYGRKLSELERLEIVGNLSAFFSVLESEMSKYGKDS